MKSVYTFIIQKSYHNIKSMYFTLPLYNWAHNEDNNMP